LLGLAQANSTNSAAALINGLTVPGFNGLLIAFMWYFIISDASQARTIKQY